MSDDRLRVDRAAVQTHVDDTLGAAGTFRGGADNVDRQQAHQIQMAEEGASADEYGSVRGATRHATDEIHTNSTKLANRTGEVADEFISNVSNAASKTLRSIGG